MVAGENLEQFAKVLPIEIYILKLQVHYAYNEKFTVTNEWLNKFYGFSGYCHQ